MLPIVRSPLITRILGRGLGSSIGGASGFKHAAPSSPWAVAISGATASTNNAAIEATPNAANTWCGLFVCGMIQARYDNRYLLPRPNSASERVEAVIDFSACTVDQLFASFG